MSEIKRCPKCGAEMKKKNMIPQAVVGGFLRAKKILPYVCTKCGYVEFYEKF
jgi:predicted nucleic-acid-binding Zn-ribbon protein